MNLEAIEQRCLSYLRDTQRLIIPVSEIMRVLDQDEDCQGIDEFLLIRYLSDHELFLVIDPNAIELPQGAAAQLELDFLKEPGIALTERIPSNDQVLVSMAAALDAMMKALEAGTNQARGDADPNRALQVQNILKRARELHDRMRKTGISEPARDDEPEPM